MKKNVNTTILLSVVFFNTISFAVKNDKENFDNKKNENSAIPSIKRVDFKLNEDKKILLESLKNEKIIDLSYNDICCPIEDNDLSRLNFVLNVIKNNKSFGLLDLKSNNIKEEHILKIFEAIKENPSIEGINLRNNYPIFLKNSLKIEKEIMKIFKNKSNKNFQVLYITFQEKFCCEMHPVDYSFQRTSEGVKKDRILPSYLKGYLKYFKK